MFYRVPLSLSDDTNHRACSSVTDDEYGTKLTDDKYGVK
jgi:hypothetical protein